ncbi:MAG: proprotein convertase P-domain-containing protein [Phycisphaerales bacterium]|nr:proprotein convertase P-domain-containing protein [Phycisphaerales bacterium]
MRDRFLALCSGTILCLATASTALAVDNPEVEDNNSKAAANAVTLAAGDSVSGTTTGTSTVAGLGSLDYFRVKTTAAALDVYRHRLTQTAGSATITPTIRGLNQSAGVIGVVDTTIQTGAGTPEYVQWYGFGKEEELYFRLAGTTATTAGYQYDLSTTTVAVLAGPTNLLPGTITISRAGHTTDTDFWVYDSNYDVIADFGNDDPNTLTRNFAVGSYLLAISNFNFANNQPAATGETFLSGAVMDFANVIVNSSTSTALNVSTRFTDVAGNQDVAATRAERFDVVFISFTVADPQVACCFGDGSCQDLLVSECGPAGGLSAGEGSVCDPNPCPEPEACCFPDGSCTDIAPAFCTGIAQGSGSNCDPNPCPQLEACCFLDGSCQDLLATLCTAAGGGPQGPGTDCDPNLCPEPGACCLPDDLCLFTLPNTCVSLGGSFVGGACGLTAAVRGYESTPNAVIPDSPVGAFPTVDVINVGDHYGIADVDVELEITHTFLGDLDIRLSHNATSVFLWQDACVGNDNMNVTADDEAGAVVCATPTLGSYAPSTAGGGALSAFDGQNANGAWTLAIDDDAGGDTGILVRWKLNITPLANECAVADPCEGAITGDANCDGSVNNFDIDFFVVGIVEGPTGASPPDVPPTAPAGYLNLGGTEDCWAKRRCWGDVNCDGVFNNFDIDPFVVCIVNTPAPGEPCVLCAVEACCYGTAPNAVCIDRVPAVCRLGGGVPQGPGTSCDTHECP